MKKSRDTIWGMMYQPILYNSYTLSQEIGINQFLTGVLGKMSNTIRNELLAFDGIQIAFRIKKLIHIPTSQLSDTLWL